MVVRVADVPLLPAGAIQIAFIQVEGQPDRPARHVAAKGDVCVDHVVAIILESDFGIPVGM